MQTAMIKFLLFAFGFSFLAAGDHPQVQPKPALSDPKAVLQRLRQFYAGHDYIYHELTYSLYADHKAATPHSVDQGVFIQSRDARYAQLASIESLTTSEYAIGVDHEDRILMIANRISMPPTATPVDQLEAWAASPEQVEIRYSSEQHDVLLMKTEFGEVEQAEIWYDKQTFQPAKIIFWYRRSILSETDGEGEPVQPRMEIEYRHTDLKGQGRERLELGAYVVQKSGQWALSPAYRGYELINNIHDLSIQN